MKLFVLLSRVPWPLEKGDKLRAYHQLRQLSKSHEVFLCCLTEEAVSDDTLNELRSIAAHVRIIRLYRALILLRMVRALFSDKPFQVHYFLQNHARRKVRDAIHHFEPDHIYCQLIRCSEYVKHLHSVRKTIDYMDALSAGLQRRVVIAPPYTRWFFREESRRVVAYENLIFDYFDAHCIISTQDRTLIHHPNRQSIAVIPNGVDADFFSPQIAAAKDTDLVFTGNMAYPPNVDCALYIVREILPELNRLRPGTRLLIAGANPTPDILALQSDQVEVTGWIDDIRTAYQRARIFIAPMRIGSGLQNKLLEAMSMELPCITSTLASNALNDQARKALFSIDDPIQTARTVVDLLNDESKRNNYGKKGRAAVQSSYEWSASAHQLDLLFFEPSSF